MFGCPARIAEQPTAEFGSDDSGAFAVSQRDQESFGHDEGCSTAECRGTWSNCASTPAEAKGRPRLCHVDVWDLVPEQIQLRWWAEPLQFLAFGSVARCLSH